MFLTFSPLLFHFLDPFYMILLRDMRLSTDFNVDRDGVASE